MRAMAHTPHIDTDEVLEDLRILGDRILVKPLRNSVIELPELNRNEDMYGEVVSVGDGFYTKKGIKVPLSVEIGDKVIFGKHAIANVVVKGERYIRIREENVLGIVD